MPSSDASLPERLATPVRAFMRTGVINVPEDASLLEAKRAMVRRGVHAVLVVSAAGGRPLAERTPHGVVAPLDLIDLVTRP